MKKTQNSQQKQSKVSKISLSTKRQDLYQIFIDGTFLCSISGNDLLESRLAVGDILSPEELDALLYRSLKGKLSSAVLTYLASRPHSENEIRQYIKRKLYANYKETVEYKNLDSNQIIDEILEKLRKLSYTNDAEFSKWLVTQRTSTRNPKSKLAIRAELQSKGISPEQIAEALNSIDTESEAKMATTVAEKKLKLLKNRILEPKELRNKLSQYLISRGYSWDIIQGVVDSLLPPF